MPKAQEINQYEPYCFNIIYQAISLSSLCKSASHAIDIAVPPGMRWSPASDFRSLGAVGLHFIVFHPPMGHTVIPSKSTVTLAGYHPLSNISKRNQIFSNRKCINVIYVSINKIMIYTYIYIYIYIYMYLHRKIVEIPSLKRETLAGCGNNISGIQYISYLYHLNTIFKVPWPSCIHKEVSNDGKSYPFRRSPRSWLHTKQVDTQVCLEHSVFREWSVSRLILP